MLLFRILCFLPLSFSHVTSSSSLSQLAPTLPFNSPFLSIPPAPSPSPLSVYPLLFTMLSLPFASLCLSLSGWVPAVELVGLVAGVTARLSGVASDQGGRRPARTIGAERLRLTAGHLSRAISVGAEARSPLVGPAYCEDQRQSFSTLCSALSPSPLSHLRSQPSLSLPPVVVCCLFEFPPDVLLQLSG